MLALLAYTLWVALQQARSSESCPAPIACPPAAVCPPCERLPSKEVIDPVTQRDRAVINDPLYPPLNRAPRMHSPEDTFRFLGYLINKMDREDSWKLFGREKQRNQGEYYVASTNKNSDLKIMLTADMVVGPKRLRDIYDIPDELTIKHPLFAPTPYTVVVNPNADLTSTMMYV